MSSFRLLFQIQFEVYTNIYWKYLLCKSITSAALHHQLHRERKCGYFYKRLFFNLKRPQKNNIFSFFNGFYTVPRTEIILLYFWWFFFYYFTFYKFNSCSMQLYKKYFCTKNAKMIFIFMSHKITVQKWLILIIVTSF